MLWHVLGRSSYSADLAVRHRWEGAPAAEVAAAAEPAQQAALVGEVAPLTNNVSVQSCESSAVHKEQMGSPGLHSRAELSGAPIHTKAH